MDTAFLPVNKDPCLHSVSGPRGQPPLLITLLIIFTPSCAPTRTTLDFPPRSCRLLSVLKRPPRCIPPFCIQLSANAVFEGWLITGSLMKWRPLLFAPPLDPQRDVIWALLWIQAEYMRKWRKVSLRDEPKWSWEALTVPLQRVSHQDYLNGKSKSNGSLL